jgi:hypothetical protein
MAKRAPKNINTPLLEEEVNLSSIVIDDEPEEAPQSVLDTLKSTALQVVSITEQVLANIEQKYAAFSIDGDPKAYKEAKQVKNRLVKIRTAIERKRIATNKAFTEATNAQCKAVVDRTSAIESRLGVECVNFEEAEQRRIEARRQHVINSLISAFFQFNGISYVCADHTVWQTEIDNLTDEQLAAYVAFGIDWHTKETARQAAEKLANEDVFLHHEASNELLTIKRGEFDAQAYADSGVIEITQELYKEIQSAKLNAFKRPTPAPSQSAPPAPVYETHTNPQPAKQSILSRFKANAPAPIYDHMAAMHTNAPTMKSVLDEYDQGFDAGYEAFRSQIIAAFQNPTLSYKRAEWIEYFKLLKSIPTT